MWVSAAVGSANDNNNDDEEDDEDDDEELNTPRIKSWGQPRRWVTVTVM